jgi:hypothetical protein
MARAGKKVMQFLENGRHLAVVSEGKVHFYKKSSGNPRDDGDILASESEP